MTPDEAQLELVNRRIDELDKQIGDAINGLMMIAQAMQFWSNALRYDEVESELEAVLDHAEDIRDCDD